MNFCLGAANIPPEKNFPFNATRIQGEIWESYGLGFKNHFLKGLSHEID
jgi:hypothetical protein